MTNSKHNSFLSVVGVLHSQADLRLLENWLLQLHPLLQAHFTDYEIVLVNNGIGPGIREIIAPLPADLKSNIFLLHLAAATNKNNAFVAGLDRANGDYTAIFELDFADNPELILDLYEETQKGYDMVYLRAKQRSYPRGQNLFTKLFYAILKNYSALKIDDLAHDTRIISRRALNSLLRLRENMRYMKAIYSMVGYKTSALPIDVPLQLTDNQSFKDRFRTSLVAITSFTTFLRSLMLWIFLGASLFGVLAIINALKVRITNYDLFGDYYEAVPGWTFLVVLISLFFAITYLNLYIISIYLANIYQEIKQRPLYILESVERF